MVNDLTVSSWCGAYIGHVTFLDRETLEEKCELVRILGLPKGGQVTQIRGITENVPPNMSDRESLSMPVPYRACKWPLPWGLLAPEHCLLLPNLRECSNMEGKAAQQ